MPTRLLLVDPDFDEAARLIALLHRNELEQYGIEHALGFDDAEGLLENNDFDAVLLDLATPVGRGAAVLKKLIALAAHIPIIVLTQTEDENAGVMAVQAGAQDFLVKSRINGDVLRRVIRYSIDRVRFRQDVDGLAREIAHRKRIADALSDSQNRMMAINDSLYEGVLVFDENGHIALSNRAADRLLSEDDKLPSRDLDSVVRLVQDEFPIAFAAGPFRQVIQDGVGIQDEDALFVRRDGRPIPVAYACVPLLEKDGVQGAILSFRDIGAFKQAQRDALQSSKLASVGQLAAGIAHEINTPIQYIGDNLRFLSNAFQSLVGLLKRSEQLLGDLDGEQADQARAALSRAREQADADYLLENIPEATRQSLEGAGQVARIVLAMKEFSHPGERAKAEVDINRSVENTVAVSRNEWKQWARLETDLEETLPRVNCLAGEINQVLLNLVVNAAHAIEEARRGANGKITIATRHLDDDHIEIAVEDNGIGMTEAVIEQIFDPFFTTKRVGKGTGQGLSICRDVIVAKHGGRISVNSTPGVGSRFSVILPIGNAEEGTGKGDDL
jgi:signal transduction histidine kinase/DNA-binding response OmpR family regulator